MEEKFRLATESEIKEGKVARAFKLGNGDVIKINDMLLEYEEMLFYEVICTRDTLFEPIYERTGRSFTIDQVNEIAKDGKLIK